MGALRRSASFHAEGPAQPRTGPVITSLKMGWRLILPITVKRNIPRQVAGDLDVVARVHGELNTSRLAEYRHKQPGEAQTGFVEPKQSHFACDQTRCEILRACANCTLVVLDVLPANTAENDDGRSIAVLEVAPNAGADGTLQLDSLHGTLQEVGKACIKVVVPRQKMRSSSGDFVAR